MEYFSDDEIPEQEEQKTEQMVISSESPELEEQKSFNSKIINNGKVKPETIEIINKTNILPYVTSQNPRNKHFKFNNDNDTLQLTSVLESIPGLTVEYNTIRDKPYISLIKNNELVGKIHFLYYNENKPEDKYIKLYLFDFVDSDFHNRVKDILVKFFENFKPFHIQGGNKQKQDKKYYKKNKTQKIQKKRYTIRRKKTLRRNK